MVALNRHTVTLVPHRESRCPAVRRVLVQAHRVHGGRLFLSYEILGEPEGPALPDALTIPECGPVQAAPALWQHTCCEAFVAPDDGVAYWEYHFAPSRAWDVHAFQAYRKGARLDPAEPAPGIDVHRRDDRLTVNAIVDLAQFDPRLATAPLRMGLAVVLEDRQGELSYWALTHPAKRPDFHRAASFTLAFAELA